MPKLSCLFMSLEKCGVVGGELPWFPFKAANLDLFPFLPSSGIRITPAGGEINSFPNLCLALSKLPLSIPTAADREVSTGGEFEDDGSDIRVLASGRARGSAAGQPLPVIEGLELDSGSKVLGRVIRFISSLSPARRAGTIASISATLRLYRLSKFCVIIDIHTTECRGRLHRNMTS